MTMIFIVLKVTTLTPGTEQCLHQYSPRGKAEQSSSLSVLNKYIKCNRIPADIKSIISHNPSVLPISLPNKLPITA